MPEGQLTCENLCNLWIKTSREATAPDGRKKKLSTDCSDFHRFILPAACLPAGIF